MFGRGKKTVSLAYKEMLLSKIAHYEKRIEEALHKRKQTSFEDESSDEDGNNTNPYKLNIRQSGFELKQQEASLSDRASMTLELAMLTIMQSEVNVMVTPPEVRRPVQEDGIWLEVAAECKIDLVSFTITFYAHKPHRRFAPIRYRNVAVDLVKPAHQRELAQSVLPKLNRPNLALQVLQSYATAFRSRRTTLLELAEKYAEKLRMEAMPEGGYRVKFLNLLQVDWTLENLWSPIVPFCHRMKFEVEYMPKDYIHAIGKLYKQFKDPSLETSERTLVLGKIFDTCLQAQGPAQDLHDNLESDPDTAGSLHERRTTIDQEPDVPNVEHSPKPKGKENKAQNRKTTMAPPKTVPKKAKKVDAKKSNVKDNIAENSKGVKRGIANDEANDAKKRNAKDDLIENRKAIRDIENDSNITAKKSNAKDEVENRKGIQKAFESDSTNTAKKRDANKEVENPKRVKGIENNAKAGVVENRKGVKRGIENEGNNDAKKLKTDEGNIDNSKSKAGLKGGKDGTEKGGAIEIVDSKNKGQKKVSDKVISKNTKAIDKVSTVSSENDATKKGDGKSGKSKSANNKPEKSGNRNKGNKEKYCSKIVDNLNNEDTKDSKASRKESKKSSANNNENDIPISKPTNTENNVVTSKKTNDKIANIKHDAKKITDVKKDERIVVVSKNGTKKGEGKSVASKTENIVSDVAISKNKTTIGGEDQNGVYSNDKGTGGSGTDTVSRASSKNVVSKDMNAKVKASTLKDKNKEDVLSKKVSKNRDKEAYIGETHEVNNKTKDDIARNSVPKDLNTAKPKEVVIKKKIDIEIAEKSSNRGTKVKDTGNFAEKVKGVKDKPFENNEMTTKNAKNKETTQSLADNKKIVNSNTVAQKSDNENKNNKATFNRTSTANVNEKKNEILAKKNLTTQHGTRPSKNKDDNKQVKKSTTDKTESVKSINPKLAQNANKNVLKEKANRNETIEKVVEKNKIDIISNVTITKPDPKNNLLNVTITKSKNIAITKQTDNQIKMADKLKTKIPMMKSKMKFLTLSDKLLPNNLGRISNGVEKMKIPQKSLPVLKKIVKNLPTRISPRKLPSTFKPGSRGFSNK